jgi:hypothetical protein
MFPQRGVVKQLLEYLEAAESILALKRTHLTKFLDSKSETKQAYEAFVKQGGFTSKHLAAYVRGDFQRKTSPSQRKHLRLVSKRPMPIVRRRICRSCNQPFEPARSDAKYCSPSCRQAAYRSRVTDNPSAPIGVTDPNPQFAELIAPDPGFGDRIAALIEEGDALAERIRQEDAARWERVKSWGVRKSS